jgi:hypothetical protein
MQMCGAWGSRLPYVPKTVRLELVWVYENEALTLQFATLYGSDGTQWAPLGQ